MIVKCFVLVPDKIYILQIMNKDNEKDDDTDSDMFCLGSRQMCRDCHPHKAAFNVELEMMMIIVINVQDHHDHHLRRGAVNDDDCSNHCPRSSSSPSLT